MMAAGNRNTEKPMSSSDLTDVHHELRTPLTSIRTLAEVLIRYPVEDVETRNRFLGIIHQEAERLARSVEDLLRKAEGCRGSRADGTEAWRTGSPEISRATLA